MSKTNKSLSGLLDEQCSSSDLDHLLNDKDVSDNRWYRYNAVSAIIKGEYSVHANMNFCKDISAKIADEPTILAAPRPQQTKNRSQTRNRAIVTEMRKVGSGFAIAASVAFATFFSVQTLQVSSELSPVNQSSAEISQINVENLTANNDSMPSSRNSLEQSNLEAFNEAFMLPARLSEKGSIAPFATSVSGKYVKTIRISAEQWQQILQRAAIKQSQLEAAEKAKFEAGATEMNDLDSGDGE